MKIGPLAALHKFSALLFLVLKPLGIWGLGGLALIDSALFPIPVSMDAVLIGYVVSAHSKFLLYCLMAAVASALGSLVPYYVGRAGGELFLLKRINRERYERMRDRFESQEFLAIMIPTMLPPPTPVKLFEFAAGVFEMRPLLYVLAVFTGKFIQFMVCALLTIYFGPTLFRSIMYEFHNHLGMVLLAVALLILAIAFFVVRKTFARRSRLRFPAEDTDEGCDEEETIP
ncbi:MAG TPA: VTT domain-containing protein [Acidobacteriaceae bacterium]